MFNITILYGSSCIGKSSTMETMKDSFLKLEMDDCEYWLLPEKERENKCITFLIDAIKSNSSSSSSSKDMVVTCGYLPLPNDQIYRKI